MKIILIVLVALIASTAHGKFGFDIAPLFNNYTCFAQQGYDWAIVRAYRSIGQIDANANQNIKNAKAAGLKTDVYMFPCVNDTKITAEKQVDDMIANLAKSSTQKSLVSQLLSLSSLEMGTILDALQQTNQDSYDRIWIDVETNPSSQCTWDNIASVEDRCNYLQRIVNQVLKQGKKVGIYASHYMWNSIFGSADNCKNFSQYPLWYARYNNVQNVSDYSQYPFGGWKSAYAKQFAGSSTLCGADVDLNYYN